MRRKHLQIDRFDAKSLIMSIYEKNGKFYCRFQIDGERHHYLCKGAINTKEARKIEDGYRYRLQQQQNGIIIRTDKKVRLKTLLQLYDQYSELNKLSYGTDAFCKYIGLFFGENTYANDIKPDKIEKFKKYLKEERYSSNATINKYLSALSKMYNLGIESGIIKANPVRAVKKLREENYKIRYLTADEEKRMFKAIDETFPYLKQIITCALQTGMRRGEIFNLKWSDIDFEFGFIELLKTKSGKSRKIPISESLMAILESIERNSDYVFVNPQTQKPFTDIHNSFRTVLRMADIKNFRFHDLRHTVATRLVEKGIDLVVVKEILGHSKIDTTMRYAHAVPKRKLDAIAVLNSYAA